MLALVVLALLVGGCDPVADPEPVIPPTPSPAPSEGTPAAGVTFRWAIGEPRGITPPQLDGPDSTAVVDALFDSLTDVDVSGAPVPAAAGEWSHDERATTWTFRIRSDAAFHDGTPVTSTSFAVAWNRLVAGGAMGHLLRDVVGHGAVAAGSLDRMSGVRTPSPDVVQVSLVRPRGDLPILLSHPALGPVQHERIVADPAAYGDQPVGNGPFRMAEPWAHDDFIRTTRWEGWVPTGDGAGVADPTSGGVTELLFRISDLDEGFLALRQGRRDLAVVPPEARELAAELFGTADAAADAPRLVITDVPSTYLLVLDPDVPPYDDPLVREAVQLLVDRQAIAGLRSLGGLVPATWVRPPVLWPASAGICELCTFNPRGAVDRLEDAGVEQLTFAFDAGGGHDEIRDVLRADLSDLGVALVSNRRGPAPPFGEYVERLAEGDTGMFRLTVTADVPSSLELLHPLLHSSSTPANGGLNFTGYDDPQVDALLEQAARTVDHERRERLLRRVEDIAVNRDHVLVPVVGLQQAFVAGETIRPFPVDPFGRVDVARLRAAAT